jgi:N4-gp56 family major capsid protein
VPITGYPSYVSIATLSNLLIPGYDKAVEFQLREMPTFRSLVDRRPVGVDNPGSTVYFTFYADLATTTTPLSETVTPDPITVANPTRISVSVNEYGAWLPKTLQLEKFAFTQVDWELAELLARQQADTIDALVKTVMDSTTNVFDNTTKNVGGSKNFSAQLLRQLRNTQRAKLVPFKDGSNYVLVAHPDITFDVMNESGTNVWQAPHIYGGDAGPIYAAEIGKYAAIRVIENTRCTTTAAASGVAGTYNSYLLGANALVEAVAVEPHTVIGEVTDPLRRFAPVGWHALLGWNLFRPEGLMKVKSQSSLAPALP